MTRAATSEKCGLLAAEKSESLLLTIVTVTIAGADDREIAKFCQWAMGESGATRSGGDS
jgi:hypothetical protein